MTKEQKYPLAEPATYAPPQMEVIPLRGNSAMLVGSGGMVNNVPIDEVGYFSSANGAYPGNYASEDVMTELENNNGWGSSF